jgi:hypothetical protein
MRLSCFTQANASVLQMTPQRLPISKIALPVVCDSIGHALRMQSWQIYPTWGLTRFANVPKARLPALV